MIYNNKVETKVGYDFPLTLLNLYRNSIKTSVSKKTSIQVSNMLSTEITH